MNKKVIQLILTTFLGGLLAVSYLYYDKNKNNPDFTKEMSAEQQTSLITSEIEAVKNNTKPKEVIGALEPRMKMLTKENKELAVDLIYTSMQNSTLYYNTLTQVFSGEINYSRGDTKNSIDSALHNKIIDGYLKELKEQKIEYYNLNRDFFVSLPDFNYLDKYKNSMSKELKLLVEAGKIGQNSSIFEKDKVNSYNALKAYNQIVQKLYELKNINDKSKYLQDISSLARFYHDVAFGYVQTNNTELNSVHYNVSRDQIEQLERAKREFKDTPDLYKEIEDYLSKIKDGKIGADFIKDQSDNSVKKFGTSVYWNSVADITSLQTQNNK
jgi:hypothetical protein